MGEKKSTKISKMSQKPKPSKETKTAKVKKTQRAAKPKKNIRIWTFSRRLLTLCLLPMVVVCALVATLSTITLKSTIEEQIRNSLQIVATSVCETYMNLYEGDYTIDFTGRVWKGETSINSNSTLIDAMQEQTGFNVSMMFGNSRLITNVPKDNGARATGIPADKEVYKRIETGEVVFLENYELFSRDCYVLYQPLINSDGSVVGAVEVVTESASVKDAVNAQVKQIILFSLAAAVVAGVIVGITSRTMVVRMGRIRTFLERLISGRLDYEPHTKNLKANDELGDIYRNCMKVQDSFKGMVAEIQTSCDDLKNAADRFSAMAQSTTEAADDVKVAVEEISEGARKQADSTAEANESVLMMGNQIALITQEVDDMAEYAADMAEKEAESEAIIGELSASNDHTKESVSKVAEQITQMNNAVSNIKKAVTMIQSIAEETDLLSLNASIEAARAGEAGKGFAVVAEQISKLALLSNESSKDIERILGEITNTSNKMVAVMGEVRVNMDAQQLKLEETRTTYQAVADGVDKSLQNITSIKKKIDVLYVSGESISDVVQDLAAISEQNAAGANNTMETTNNMSDTMQTVQESSKELLVLADRLQEALGSFRI